MATLISTSTSVLKTDAPVLEFYTHMNRLYMFLEQNSECFRGQDYSTITIVVTAYGEDNEGNLNPDDRISSWNRVFQQYQINERFQTDGFPPYNIWTQLENYWYEIQLNFNFQYNSGESGGNSYPSKLSTFTFDNRLTTLTSLESSRFFTGLLRDNLGAQKEFTAWFGITPTTYTQWDMVSNASGTLIKQITDVVGTIPNQEARVLPAEENYLNIIKYIINHERTGNIFVENFGEIAPDPISAKAIFTFNLYLNNESYLIHFRGDFQFLINRSLIGVVNG